MTFVFYPAQGDLIEIITDIPRLIFTTSCLLICTGFFKLDISFGNLIHKPLTLLGEGSYSLYLLHPIVYNFMFLLNKHVLHVSTPLVVAISIISTFVLSYFVYTHFEKYFMKLAKSSAIRSGD
jgi:peptidoglycan/LPS O-acetylase OafA/YrhL